jgi:hypothetical protein
VGDLELSVELPHSVRRRGLDLLDQLGGLGTDQFLNTAWCWGHLRLGVAVS